MERIFPSNHSRRAASILVAACLVLLLAPGTAAAQTGNYIIGAQDVLSITVVDEPDLSGKYAVELDGTFSFPFIGRVKAGGMPIRDFETELRTRLAAGYFQNPHLTVAIEQYRSQRVVIVGEVKNAGTYTLSGEMTLIEALAKAGSTTPAAGDEVIILRGSGAGAAVLPEGRTGEDVVRVHLRDLQSGSLSVRNLRLGDGDTIYVPRAEIVYVFGHVKNPGSYPVQSDITVLQVLSLAGGVMPNGATNRLAVIRMIDGTKKEFKVKLTDIVRPGDTIVVPERFF
jgi:polysaccharide export outer membrane protein